MNRAQPGSHKDTVRTKLLLNGFTGSNLYRFFLALGNSLFFLGEDLNNMLWMGVMRGLNELVNSHKIHFFCFPFLVFKKGNLSIRVSMFEYVRLVTGTSS